MVLCTQMFTFKDETELWFTDSTVAAYACGFQCTLY